MESSSVSFTIYDREGIILAANSLARRRGTEIYGKELREGTSIYDFVIPEHRDLFDQHFARVLSGQTVQFELDIAGPYFHPFLYTYTPLREGGSPPWGVCLTIEDLQPLRSAEHSVREKENRNIYLASRLETFSRAVEQSPVSILITDPQGAIEYVNPRLAELTGYAEAELIGKNPRILKSGAMQESLYGELWQTISRGGTWRGEMQNRKKDGDLFWEEAVISPIRDPSGDILHFIGIKQDITDRKRSEQALRLLLEEKDVLIKELYHRTKNNMQTVAALMTLQMEYSKDAGFVKVADSIRGQIQALSTVQDHLFSRKNLSRIELAPLVQDLVRQAVAERAQFGRKIATDFDLPDLDVSLEFGNSFGLVIQELATNSMIHAFRERAEGAIALKAAIDDGALEVTYQDDGPGCAPSVDLREPKTFGFSIVVNLIREQLRGSIDFACDDNFFCRMRLPLPRIEERVRG